MDNQLRLDANEVAFFNRELEHVKARTYDVKYAELRAAELIPVSFEAGPAADSIVYQQWDAVGVAKIIASYATDLPRCDVYAREFTATVKSFGAAYGFSLQEVRAASKAGKPLDQRKAAVTRRANDQLVNSVAWYGDAASNLQGLLYNPSVGRSFPAADGTGGSTRFASKTPDQILRDLNKLVNDVVKLTKGVERPDTVLLPIEQYTYISSTPRSSTSDTTILEYFLKNNPFVKTVTWLNEATTQGGRSASLLVPNLDVAIAYTRDAMHLTLEIPQPFEQLPPQVKGLGWEVNCHSRNAGVLVYYPLAINIMEGI